MIKTVLLVEDYDDVRAMMSILLRHHGFEVLEAADGREAVEKAAREKPDLILMDIGLPVLDGIEATRAIRGMDEMSGTPIIAVTAFSDSKKEMALEAGCDHVMQKPLDFEKLEPLLKRFALES